MEINANAIVSGGTCGGRDVLSHRECFLHCQPSFVILLQKGMLHRRSSLQHRYHHHHLNYHHAHGLHQRVADLAHPASRRQAVLGHWAPLKNVGLLDVRGGCAASTRERLSDRASQDTPETIVPGSWPRRSLECSRIVLFASYTGGRWGRGRGRGSQGLVPKVDRVPFPSAWRGSGAFSAHASPAFSCQEDVTPFENGRPPAGIGEEAERGEEAGDLLGEREWQRLTASPLLRKTSAWAGVAALVYFLRSFAGVFVATFFLSVVGNSAVEKASTVFAPERRRLLISIFFVSFVSVFALMATMQLPHLQVEGSRALLQLQTVLMDLEGSTLDSILFSQLRPIIGNTLVGRIEEAVTSSLRVSSGASGGNGLLASGLLEATKKYSPAAFSCLSCAALGSGTLLFQVVVSLILSFMLLWDLPSLRLGLHSLSTSRLAFVYHETAPAIATFGRVFSRALEAQSMVAVVNTALTAVGLMALSIRNIPALSLLVFCCSFIPIAGVFLSTVPIGAVALLQGGLNKLFLVLSMVVAVHGIEAYILNPFIYSAHLKLHPILTLVVLLVSEHVLGVWGLLLAVPITSFTIDHLIFQKPFTLEERPSAVPGAPLQDGPLFEDSKRTEALK